MTYKHKHQYTPFYEAVNKTVKSTNDLLTRYRKAHNLGTGLFLVEEKPDEFRPEPFKQVSFSLVEDPVLLVYSNRAPDSNIVKTHSSETIFVRIYLLEIAEQYGHYPINFNKLFL